MALQLQECLDGRGNPEWMTKGRTVLLIKDKAQGNLPWETIGPITSLPIMWKALTRIIVEDLYQHLHQSLLLPDEQKGCRKESRGTKDQLVIGRAILRDCKQRKPNLAIAWIGYKIAYDSVPHSWTLKTLDLEGVADNIKQLIRESTESWKTQLTACGKDLRKCPSGEEYSREILFYPLCYLWLQCYVSAVYWTNQQQATNSVRKRAR